MSINKITAERNQRALLELASQPGNDICADCKTRHPRWSSYNLGIFICVNCASIHRKIGTHVTKVKSLTLDSWSKEQVEFMKQHGNVKSNTYYNPNETRNPPPTNMMEFERDSELEKFIRSKYEYKRFIDKSAIVASKLGPSRSAASLASRSKSTPLTNSNSSPTVSSPTIVSPSSSSNRDPVNVPQHRPSTAEPNAPNSLPQMRPTRSVSQPLTSLAPPPQAVQPQQTPIASNNPVWADLVSLQSTSSPSLPLQFQSSPYSSQSLSVPNSLNTGNGLLALNPFAMGTVNNGLVNPGQTYPSAPLQTQYSLPSGIGMLNTGQGIINTGINPANPYQQQQQQFTPTGYQGSMPPSSFNQTYGISSSPINPPSSTGFGGALLQPSPMFQQQPQFGQQQQPQFYPTPSPGLQASQVGQQYFQPQPQQQPGYMSHSPQPFHTTPSPFGQQLPQQPQMFSPPGGQTQGNGNNPGSNPFTSWMSTGPGGGPGGFAQGQGQWRGM